MKKRLLASMLAICMVFALIPTTALALSTENCTDASCNHAAAIGSTHYDTLASAIETASQSETAVTVTLLRDTQEKITVPSGKITIDLNGNTLTCKEYYGTYRDFIGAINTSRRRTHHRRQ